MSGFKYGYDYERFANTIAYAYRYRTDREAEEFLATVLETTKRRRSVLRQGTKVWRAQLGAAEPTSEQQSDGNVVIGFDAHPPERMKPLANSATEGRANAKGIPVLYVATSPETAMSEVRPNLASDISLADLEIERELTLVDCTTGSGRSIYSYEGNEIPAEEREEVVWRSINDAFTRPVDPSDRLADYAPTQVMAEYFRKEGFDGIRYRSGFTEQGANIALFSLNGARVLSVRLMRARSINFTFSDWP